MSDVKSTKLNIREDRPTAMTSSIVGANLDVLGFNLSFLMKHNPKLAAELLRIFALASAVREDDPPAPKEDIALFAEEVAKLRVKKPDKED